MIRAELVLMILRILKAEVNTDVSAKDQSKSPRTSNVEIENNSMTSSLSTKNAASRGKPKTKKIKGGGFGGVGGSGARKAGETGQGLGRVAGFTAQVPGE